MPALEDALHILSWWARGEPSGAAAALKVASAAASAGAQAAAGEGAHSLRGAVGILEPVAALTEPRFSIIAVVLAFVAGCCFWPVVDVLALFRQFWERAVFSAQIYIRTSFNQWPPSGHPRLH